MSGRNSTSWKQRISYCELSFAILLACLLAVFPAAGGAEKEKVGLFPCPQRKSGIEKIEMNYQQSVWLSLLGMKKMYEVCVLKGEDINAQDGLKKYRALIMPAARTALTKEGFANLKEYVGSGGKLVRESNGGCQVDANGNGLADDKGDAASSEFLAAYWKEVGGALTAGRYQNFVRQIRFLPAAGSLTEGLPTELMADFSKSDRFKWTRGTVYYILYGACPVAEAEIENIASWNSNDPAKPLEGTFPVVTLNRYGQGYCLSIGLNFARVVIGISAESDVYRDFTSNLLYWLIETE